ncbi:28710_t:CDS:2 [Racocetra persica]|uniref:28710_t:CDS:1 n=1 Tax=Racocetra persica TaxID=160502 RepID=A0ACA9M088_9GLOM|nr:28710_t:CDS:2 [Racocetra persica]
MEQTYSDISTGNKIEVHKFLEALGLLDNEVIPVNMDNDDNSESDIDEEDSNDEDSDDDQDNYWDSDPRKKFTGWDYERCFGEDALKKLYRDQEARQRFILLRLFTMRLSNLSKQAKNRLFVAFSRSNSFGVLEHNVLLDALAHPVKGLNLFEYDELGSKKDLGYRYIRITDISGFE